MILNYALKLIATKVPLITIHLVLHYWHSAFSLPTLSAVIIWKKFSPNIAHHVLSKLIYPLDISST